MAGKVFMVSMYMNEEFYENYYKPFLKLIINDPSYQLEIKYIRPKRGKKSAVPEVESSAIRSLIRRYVTVKKQKMIKKEQTENESTT